jgi:hypothetical protein
VKLSKSIITGYPRPKGSAYLKLAMSEAADASSRRRFNDILEGMRIGAWIVGGRLEQSRK